MPDNQDVTRMEAGRELDALVAERVMELCVWRPAPEHRQIFNVTRAGGWKASCGYIGEFPPNHCHNCHRSTWATGAAGPAHSSDIAAAWQVVEKMREHSAPRYRNLTLTAYCYARTYATFDADAMSDYNPATWAEANGDHATPLAICRAALLAVGALVEKP